MRRDGRDAPIPAIRVTATELVISTQTGPSQVGFKIDGRLTVRIVESE
jgi:hypothetical protein